MSGPDLDAVLSEVRSLADRMLDDSSEQIDTGDAVRLAHLVAILDGAARSGRLPSSWTEKSGRTQ